MRIGKAGLRAGMERLLLRFIEGMKGIQERRTQSYQ